MSQPSTAPRKASEQQRASTKPLEEWTPEDHARDRARRGPRRPTLDEFKLAGVEQSERDGVTVERATYRAPDGREFVRTASRAERPIEPETVEAIRLETVALLRLRQHRGRVSRPAANARRRGSRRGGRSGTRATRAGPPDDDELPPRRCGCGCGADISHKRPQARYLDDTHAKRAERQRQREQLRDAPHVEAHRTMLRERFLGLPPTLLSGEFFRLDPPDRAEVVEILGARRSEDVLRLVVWPRHDSPQLAV